MYGQVVSAMRACLDRQEAIARVCDTEIRNGEISESLINEKMYLWSAYEGLQAALYNMERAKQERESRVDKPETAVVESD